MCTRRLNGENPSRAHAAVTWILYLVRYFPETKCEIIIICGGAIIEGEIGNHQSYFQYLSEELITKIGHGSMGVAYLKGFNEIKKKEAEDSYDDDNKVSEGTPKYIHLKNVRVGGQPSQNPWWRIKISAIGAFTINTLSA